MSLLKLFFGILLCACAGHAEDLRISDRELVRRQGFREFVQSVLDFDQSREAGANLAKQGREDWLKKSKDGIIEQREQQKIFEATVDESGAAYHSAWRERMAYQQELDSYRQEYRNERAPLHMIDPRWNLPTESQEYGLVESARVDWKKRKFIGAPGSAMASSNNDYVPPPPPPAVPPNNFDAPPPPPMPPQGEYYDYPPPPAPYYDDQQPQY